MGLLSSALLPCVTCISIALHSALRCACGGVQVERLYDGISSGDDQDGEADVVEGESSDEDVEEVTKKRGIVRE